MKGPHLGFHTHFTKPFEHNILHNCTEFKTDTWSLLVEGANQ